MFALPLGRVAVLLAVCWRVSLICDESVAGGIAVHSDHETVVKLKLKLMPLLLGERKPLPVEVHVITSLVS